MKKKVLIQRQTLMFNNKLHLSDYKNLQLNSKYMYEYNVQVLVNGFGEILELDIFIQEVVV